MYILEVVKDADIITIRIKLGDHTFGGIKYPDLFPSVAVTLHGNDSCGLIK